MGVIIWNGISSLNVGLRTSGLPKYDIAEYDMDTVEVPGRNGDILQDNHRFKNVHPTYDIAIDSRKNDFNTCMSKFAQWLQSSHKYARLEDSENPNTYRFGIPEGQVQIENILRTFGKASISFNCKPQRFLKSGEIPIILSKSGIINNPTMYTSLPLITIYGSGAGILTIGQMTLSISEIGGYVVIDSENQRCYHGTDKRESTVSGPYPEILSGNNNIVISGGITSIEVIPYFWTL